MGRDRKTQIFRVLLQALRRNRWRSQPLSGDAGRDGGRLCVRDTSRWLQALAATPSARLTGAGAAGQHQTAALLVPGIGRQRIEAGLLAQAQLAGPGGFRGPVPFDGQLYQPREDLGTCAFSLS